MKDVGYRLDNEGLLPHVETGTYGNMSIRDENSFVITGRNVDKGNLTTGLLNRVVDFEKVEHDTLHSKVIQKDIYCEVFYEGEQKPSIDSGIHSHIYDEFNFQALAHIHTNRIFQNLYLTPDNPPCGSSDECEQTLDGFRSGGNRTGGNVI